MLPELLSKPSYSSYVISALTSTPLYTLWSSVVKYFKRFFFVTRLFRYTAAVIYFIEKSAIFLTAFIFILGTLPVLATALLFAALTERIRQIRLVRKISIPNDMDIYVFVSSEAFGRPVGSFGMAEANALSNDAAVFIVTDKLTQNLLNKNSGGVMTISRSCFFRLRRAIFDKRPQYVKYLFT